ncbi:MULTISPECIES: lysis protein [unclassified Photorhabdus]|uniref:lysis protein n=1 Tax=unclassified Photorhabdus TaxID=2620880 RepID=UPI000DCC9B97|nr:MULTISPECIES: lysis protein [unclassified Photorhabdus]RAW90617.1 peptidase [Photorhabdus sp. S9-53]RAW90731.1 peptidase [Photorhabdus sp. S10-54]RAW95159.1 peptidase [Photorhabdus sp. S8-52]
MKFNAHYYTLIALIIVSLTAYYYHSALQKERHVTKQQQEDIQQLTDAIDYQNSHIAMLNELDVKHTKELAHAKSEIDVLRNDVAAGRRRLRIAATCSQGEASSSPGVDDAASPRLEDPAIRDYFTLTERVTTMQAQLEGLQDYIKTQCQ